jgi:hypothetical protein
MIDLLPLVAAIAFSSAPGTPHPHPATRPTPAVRSQEVDALLSKRAVRRAKLLIQLRLYELRDEHLECVRKAILRRLPWDLHPQEPLRDCLEADSSVD